MTTPVSSHSNTKTEKPKTKILKQIPLDPVILSKKTLLLIFHYAFYIIHFHHSTNPPRSTSLTPLPNLFSVVLCVLGGSQKNPRCNFLSQNNNRPQLDLQQPFSQKIHVLLPPYSYTPYSFTPILNLLYPVLIFR